MQRNFRKELTMAKKARLGADPLKWIQDSREKKSDNLEQSSNQENIDNSNIQNKPKKQGLSELQEKSEKSSKQEGIPSKSELLDKPCNTEKEGIPGGWQRATFIIREKHLEKIKAIAYWDRLQIKEVIEEALEEYLAKREVKPMPPRRKN